MSVYINQLEVSFQFILINFQFKEASRLQQLLVHQKNQGQMKITEMKITYNIWVL
jgi:hypothetical protein